MTGVLLSIDTELTWRAHEAGATWQENLARSFDCAGVGVAYQLDALRRHGLNACFFVDPMPAVLFGIEPVRRMVAPIVAAGQEVQLHLHTMWPDAGRRARDGQMSVRFELTGLPLATQRALIEQARELLIEAGAPSPVAFRSGAFGGDAATLAALAAAGFRYDSTHNGAWMPWPCDTGLSARQVAPCETHGLIELPVTTLDEGGGRLRHLQIAAVSVAEMRAAILHAEREHNPLVTIVGHGFELANRAGTRANRIVRRRFDALCAWLGRNADRFPTRRIDTLPTLATDVAATPACVPGYLRAVRMATQATSNLIYEGRIS